MEQAPEIEHQLVSLAPNADIRLRSWDENAVLYHGAAASTYEISALMAVSLKILQSGSQSPAALAEMICVDHQEVNKSECLEHLVLGYRELESQGIIQRFTE
jgi:hypothetical protein